MTATLTTGPAARVRALVDSGEARRRREGAGLTLQDAARMCGDVYPSAVLRWEQGTRTPRSRNLRAYDLFLGQLAPEDAR